MSVNQNMSVTSKLKKPLKACNNSPKKLSKYTYMNITDDHRVRWNEQLLKNMAEYMKNLPQ